MHSLIRPQSGAGLRPAILILLSSHAIAATLHYETPPDAPGPWPAIFSSIGLTPGKDGVVVAAPDAPTAEWPARVEQGTILIVQGESPAAAAFGFLATAKRTTVRSVEDARAPKLEIIWEQALELPVFETPKDARVFARDKREGA